MNTERNVTEHEGMEWKIGRAAMRRPAEATAVLETEPCGHRAVAADTDFLIGLAREDEQCLFIRDALRQIGYSFVLSRNSFEDVQKLQVATGKEEIKQKVSKLLDETFTTVPPVNDEETTILAGELMRREVVDRQDDAFALAEAAALDCGIFLTSNPFLLALDPELMARQSLSLKVSLPICVSPDEVFTYLQERPLLKRVV